MKFQSRDKSQPIFLLYILVGYIFVSFIWWSYLMLDKNEQLFRIQCDYVRLKQNSSNIIFSESDFNKSREFIAIKNKYDRQKLMIIGEGTVFMLMLIFGSILLLKTFNKEVLLAKQQNNFLLSVTHEFKTPLSSIKLSFQTLMKRINMEDKFQKLVRNSLDDVDRLQVLVDNILFAARMENHSYTFEKTFYNISDLLIQFIEKLKHQQPGGERILLENIDTEIEYNIDKESFFSLVANLIENALKYSPEDKPVMISLFKKDSIHIVFEVKDYGIGIPSDERNKIFDKFYRIGNEETRNTKGTGLGLFIVKKVIEAHNGRILYLENVPKGSIFRIILPLNK